DDPVGPVIVDAEELAEILLEAEEAARLGNLALRLDLIDISLGDAENLAFEHGVVDPFHQDRPALIALPGIGTEELPRDQLWEDHPIIGVLHRRARGRDAAAVIGVAVAAPGFGRREGFLGLLE